MLPRIARPGVLAIGALVAALAIVIAVGARHTYDQVRAEALAAFRHQQQFTAALLAEHARGLRTSGEGTTAGWAVALEPALDVTHGWVIDAEGTIVAHHDPLQLGTHPFDRRDLAPELMAMVDKMAHGEPGVATYPWQYPDGTWDVRLAAFAPVDGEVGTSVAVSDSAGAALSGVEQALTALRRAALVIILTLVGAAGVVVWQVRRSGKRKAREQRAAVAAADMAAHTERLAQLGALTAGVAHDLRGPLGALRLGVDELDEDGVGDPMLRRDLRRAIDLMQDLTSDLTRFSRSDDGEAAAELGATLRSSLRMLGPLRSARCEVQFEQDVAWVGMSGLRVSQVLLNLIGNAFAVAERVRVVVSVEAEQVVLAIEDDGPGIPPEIAERVFEPFFTTKPAGEGTGLGLSLCRRFIEEAGGTLTLRASSLGGAALCVTLRRVEPRASPQPVLRVA